MRALYSFHNRNKPLCLHPTLFWVNGCNFPEYIEQNQMPKYRLLEGLHKAVFSFLVWDENHSSNIDALLDVMDKEKKAFFQNKSVLRAAHFRDYLLYYPEERTAENLLVDVCTLYASKEEFPKGLGNSQMLRQRISECLTKLLYEPYVQKMLSCAPNANSETVGKQMIKRQKDKYKLIYLYWALHNINTLPRDMEKLILDFSLQLGGLLAHDFWQPKISAVVSNEQLINIEDEDGTVLMDDFVLTKHG